MDRGGRGILGCVSGPSLEYGLAIHAFQPLPTPEVTATKWEEQVSPSLVAHGAVLLVGKLRHGRLRIRSKARLKLLRDKIVGPEGTGM